MKAALQLLVKGEFGEPEWNGVNSSEISGYLDDKLRKGRRR